MAVAAGREECLAVRMQHHVRNEVLQNERIIRSWKLFSHGIYEIIPEYYGLGFQVKVLDIF